MIQLHLGDCLEVMKQIPDKSVDLVLTDPPYGTTACSWDSVIPFEPMWEQLFRIRKESSGVVLFGSEPFSSQLRISNLKNFKYDWIWKKDQISNPLLAKVGALKNHEIVSVFFKNNYYPQGLIPISFDRKKDKSNIDHLRDSKKAYTQTETNYPKSVIDFPCERGFHPTQKPVDLLEYLIKTYTKENETVLDFTMGSGSTGVACKHLNRSFIGIEKDETYFNIAKRRIENAQMCIQTDLFEAGL
jgi:DNA modification methylase